LIDSHEGHCRAELSRRRFGLDQSCHVALERFGARLYTVSFFFEQISASSGMPWSLDQVQTVDLFSGYLFRLTYIIKMLIL